MSGTVPKTRKSSKHSQNGQKVQQKQTESLSPEEKLLERQLEEQKDNVRRQAIEDAANGRNRNLLNHVLQGGSDGDDNHLTNYSYKRAERMQKMLNVQDEMNKSMARCKHIQEKGSKLSKKDKAQEEVESKSELKERIMACEEFIEEIQDLNSTALAAKNIFLEEQLSAKQLRGGPKSLETQVAKQHKQSRKQLEEVDGRRVWRGYYPGTRYVGRAAPWTSRQSGSKMALEDETLRDEFLELIREDDTLFNSALKPLIKETQSIISEMYTALAEAKREESIMKRLTEPKVGVLQLERKTLTELRRYQRPPPLLHTLTQAMLLLLGFDEFTTFEWDKCKTLLNPNGSHTEKGLNTRIEEFRVDELKEPPFDEIAQRVHNIMSELDFKEVNKTSPAAVTLYIWVNGKLKELQGAVDMEQEGADVRRQIEILHAKSNPKGAQKMLASYRSSGQPK